MKKILFIWPQIDNDGGGEFALVNLLHNLHPYYKIDVLCYENIYKQVLPAGLNVFFASQPSQNKIGKLINKFKLMYKLFQLVSKYELLILNDVPFINILVWFVTRITGSKYLIWAHSCRDEMDPTNKKLIHFIYKKSLICAERIICVSNYAAKSMRNYLNASLVNIDVIYNIIVRKMLINDDISLPNDITKICAVGRMAPEKNFALLIDALNAIKKQANNKFHLYLCGDGLERQSLEAQIERYQMNEFVTLVGHTVYVMSYISQCDILVSSSNSEALPTVVYEGLLCNKAVIVTNTGAAEIVEYGEYGVVVERKNVKQMSTALLGLISNAELRKQYGDKAHNALRKFNSADIVKRWTEIIEKITRANEK